MADFQKAFDYMGPHEWSLRKHFTNLPQDPGGATNWGVTLRTFSKYGTDLNGDGVVDVEDLRIASLDDAKVIYGKVFWIWDGIDNDIVASKCFDTGVNTGNGMATAFLQKALCAIGCPVGVDGQLGPQTLDAVNGCDASKLLTAFCHLQAAHYQEWIAKEPSREIFRNGLMARAMELPNA